MWSTIINTIASPRNESKVTFRGDEADNGDGVEPSDEESTTAFLVVATERGCLDFRLRFRGLFMVACDPKIWLTRKNSFVRRTENQFRHFCQG